MITPKLYDTFDVLIDEYGTGDATNTEKGIYFRKAIRDFVLDRITPKDKNAPYSFQINNRIRAELGPIYVGPETITLATAGVLDTSTELANSYAMMGRLRVLNSNGDYKPCWPVTSAQAAETNNDPFFDGQEEPVYEETSAGIYIQMGKQNYIRYATTKVETYYVKKWTEPYRGPIVLAGSSLTVGNLMYVEEGSVTYNSNPYSQGETFTVVSGVTVFTGSGQCSVIRNNELPDHAHEEIIDRACYYHLIAMGESNKANSILKNIAIS